MNRQLQEEEEQKRKDAEFASFLQQKELGYGFDGCPVIHIECMKRLSKMLEQMGQERVEDDAKLALKLHCNLNSCADISSHRCDGGGRGGAVGGRGGAVGGGAVGGRGVMAVILLPAVVEAAVLLAVMETMQ
jgi:hypothetical protein